MIAQAPPVNTEVVDWWLRVGSVQGLAFVFLACFLLIVLWVAIVLLGLAKRWVPKWFESSMRTHATMRAGMREVVAIARQIRRDTAATRIGLGNALRGAETHLNKPGTREKHGIGSDVVVWVQNARREIERDDAECTLDTSRSGDWPVELDTELVPDDDDPERETDTKPGAKPA